MQRRAPELHHPTPTHPLKPYDIPSSPPLASPGMPASPPKPPGMMRSQFSSSEYQRFSSPPVPPTTTNGGARYSSAGAGGPGPGPDMYGGMPYNAYGHPQQPLPPHQQQRGWGPGQQQQPGGVPSWANDATAQMGMQFGKSAITAGHDYVEKNVSLASIRLLSFPFIVAESV
jgi:hypothetical protein